MAKAPRPGKTDAKDSKPRFLKLRLREETLEVGLALSLQEAFVVRNAAGCSVESLMQSFGMDSFAVLWFLARRQNGEPNLPWAKFAAEWDPDLSEDDIDLDEVNVDAEPAEEDSPLDDGPG